MEAYTGTRATRQIENLESELSTLHEVFKFSEEKVDELDKECVNLHQRLAGEKLRADQGWSRANSSDNRIAEISEECQSLSTLNKEIDGKLSLLESDQKFGNRLLDALYRNAKFFEKRTQDLEAERIDIVKAALEAAAKSVSSCNRSGGIETFVENATDEIHDIDPQSILNSLKPVTKTIPKKG